MKMEPEEARRKIDALRANVEKVIKGKSRTVMLAVTSLVCDGQLLVEDVPGVGKTMLANALARSIDASFQRIQFTPDLLPSDVTGVSLYNQKSGDVRVPARPRVREHRPDRRDKPDDAAHPVQPSRGDGGAPGDR